MTDWISLALAVVRFLFGLVVALPAAAALGSLVLGVAVRKLIDLATRRYEAKLPVVARVATPLRTD